MNTCGKICDHRSGIFVAVSNRGHQSIVILRMKGKGFKKWQLVIVGHFPIRGLDIQTSGVIWWVWMPYTLEKGNSAAKLKKISYCCLDSPVDCVSVREYCWLLMSEGSCDGWMSDKRRRDATRKYVRVILTIVLDISTLVCPYPE